MLFWDEDNKRTLIQQNMSVDDVLDATLTKVNARY